MINMRTVSKAIICVFTIIFFGKVLVSQDIPESRILFPLTKGNRWDYDIVYRQKNAGVLRVSVINKYQIKSIYNYNLDVFRLSFNDTYKNKQYSKDIMTDGENLYIYNGKDRTSFPFLNHFIHVGDQMGEMLVIEDQEREVFKNSLNTVVTLHHIDKDIIEKYMNTIGLLYYRNNDLEYVLKDAVIIK